MLEFSISKKLKPDFAHRAINYRRVTNLCAKDAVGKLGQSTTRTVPLVDWFLCNRTVVIFGFGFGQGLAFLSIIIKQAKH